MPGLLSRRFSIPLMFSDESLSHRDMRERYTLFGDRFDLGRLLEDIDWQAGEVADRQAGDGISAVTVALQGTPIRQRFTLENDYSLNLYTTGVFGKSLEVGIDVSSNDGRQERYVTTFYLTFVGLKDGRPATLPEADASTGLERCIASQARERRETNLAYRTGSLEPTAQELQMMDSLEGMPAKEATATTEELMEYRRRNPYGVIFGGYLLNRMFRRAWIHANAFVREATGGQNSLPLVAAIQRATFDKPVKVGDLVTFTTSIAYTHDTSFLVNVTADARSPGTQAEPLRTNTSSFTFVPVSQEGGRIQLPVHVKPYTEREMHAWVEGYRARTMYLETKHRLPTLHPRTAAILSPD